MIFKKKVNKKDWKDISLGQFIDIENIIKGEGSEITKTLKIQKIVYGEEKGDIDFLSTPIPKKNIQRSYRINGKTYKQRANLTKFNACQYIDYSTAKTIQDYLTIILVPSGSKYNDGSYELDETREDVLNLCIIDCKALSDFLERQLKVSIQLMLGYLKDNPSIQLLMKNMKEEQKQEYLDNTESLISYIQYALSLT